MTLKAFLGARGEAWKELDETLRRARGRPERLGPDGVRRLGELYRAAAADLALARRSFGAEPAVVELERLVVRARQAVYAEPARRGSGLEFIGRGYWQLVRERLPAVALATALLLLPGLAAALWALGDPGAALGLIPEDLRGAVEPVADTGMSPAESAAFSSQVLTNNIFVTVLAFALGLTLGLGTAFVLVSNGLVLGVVVGGAIEAGNGTEILQFVAAHGVLELSAIVVAGAAGLRLGSAIVTPGSLSRLDALVAEARPTVRVVLGTAPWLVLAGLVEGWVTRAGIALAPGLVIGLGLAAVYWGMVLWLGRQEPSTDVRDRATGS